MVLTIVLAVKYNKARLTLALAGVTQFVGASSMYTEKIGGSSPGQGTYLGCEFNSQSGHLWWQAANQYFSLIFLTLMSLSLPLSLCLKSINISIVLKKRLTVKHLIQMLEEPC